MSLREAALTALFARLNASLAARNPVPVIRRNETVPQRLPAGGLVAFLAPPAPATRGVKAGRDG